MTNRCDSVDALMYAYYAFMKSKEENQMLKKNKDYVEFTLQYTSVDWARSKDCPEVCLKGYSDFSFPGVPIMDVVCNEFDHKVVMISKSDFERLQTENEQLKQKLQVPDPIQEYKELLEKLHSKDDVEKFEWTLNHICGGKASVNGWMVTAKLWRRNYETLSKLIGFSSVEEIQDYLTNEAECDTLQEAISKLKDQVKYTCDEWYSANSRNNSWKAAAECNSPKELIEKLNLLRDDISGRSTVIESYKRDIKEWQKATGCLRPEDISTASLVTKAMQLDQEVKILNGALQEWKECTGCPSPSAAKTLIESGASWHHAYNEIKASNVKLRELEEENADLYAEIRKWKDSTKCEKPEAAATWITSYESACERGNRLAKMVEKLKEEVDSWKNVTGYSTPEDYMHARISGAFHTPSDYTAAWQTATKCDTPDQVKSRIEGLENAIRLTNKNMIKEIESNIDEWQKATGCDTPEAAETTIRNLRGRIDEMKEFAAIASNWTDRIVED